MFLLISSLLPGIVLSAAKHGKNGNNQEQNIVNGNGYVANGNNRNNNGGNGNYGGNRNVGNGNQRQNNGNGNGYVANGNHRNNNGGNGNNVGNSQNDNCQVSKGPKSTCHYWGDPHLETFSAKKLDVKPAGSYILYKRAGFEVQANQGNCGGVATCIKSVNVFYYFQGTGHYATFKSSKTKNKEWNPVPFLTSGSISGPKDTSGIIKVRDATEADNVRKAERSGIRLDFPDGSTLVANSGSTMNGYLSLYLYTTPRNGDQGLCTIKDTTQIQANVATRAFINGNIGTPSNCGAGFVGGGGAGNGGGGFDFGFSQGNNGGGGGGGGGGTGGGGFGFGYAQGTNGGGGGGGGGGTGGGGFGFGYGYAQGNNRGNGGRSGGGGYGGGGSNANGGSNFQFGYGGANQGPNGGVTGSGYLKGGGNTGFGYSQTGSSTVSGGGGGHLVNNRGNTLNVATKTNNQGGQNLNLNYRKQE
jgi:hypothetical protein